jgi:heme-degrading monooxygenase HmoA
MYVLIWQFQVRAGHTAEFEKIYSTSGAWTKLFKKAEGFLDTQLLRSENDPCRYITIDRWTSSGDYESFRSQWKSEYARLDGQSKDLTEQETLLGKWELILPEPPQT